MELQNYMEINFFYNLLFSYKLTRNKSKRILFRQFLSLMPDYSALQHPEKLALSYNIWTLTVKSYIPEVIQPHLEKLHRCTTQDISGLSTCRGHVKHVRSYPG